MLTSSIPPTLPAVLALIGLGLTGPGPLAVDRPDFVGVIHPLFSKYCYECHTSTPKENRLKLVELADEAAFKARHQLLDDIAWMVEEREMPPARHGVQPTEAEREQILAWAQGLLAELRNAQPDDPGLVVMPRINHREYDLVVRELTGRDLAIGQYLTEDGRAGAGFYNVGHAQTMTVGQFEAFLLAAKRTVSHARITPGIGAVWLGQPLPDALDERGYTRYLGRSYAERLDQEKDAQLSRHLTRLKRERRMVLGAYLEAAWQYHHRAALGMPDADIAAIAEAYPVPLYPGALAKAYALIAEDPATWSRWADGDERALAANIVIQRLREAWRALPAPHGSNPFTVEDQCRAVGSWYDRYGNAEYNPVRSDLEDNPRRYPDPDFQQERGKTHQGEQPFVIDLSKATGGSIHLNVVPTFDGHEGDVVVWKLGQVDGKPWHQVLGAPRAVLGSAASFDDDGSLTVHAPSIVALQVPAGARRLTVELQLAPGAEDSASVQGIITDEPVVEADRETLARRWVLGSQRSKAAIAVVQQRAAFEGLTTTNRNVTRLGERSAFADLDQALVETLGQPWPQESPRKLDKLFALSVEDILLRADAATQTEIEQHRAQLRDHAAAAEADEQPAARAVIEAFAAKAWRRAPSSEELDDLLALFADERAAGLSFDAAVKVPLSAVLASPYFLYRLQEARGSDEAYALAPQDLAERLAFTLWGSLPDAELLAAAEGGALATGPGLAAQVERMLGDDRVAGLASEFAGQWLRFADFASKASPDQERFKGWSESLKAAMDQEVQLFFQDLFQHDRPITDVLDGRATFLNQELAEHYGIAGVRGSEMRRVELADRRRGGILGMGSVLVMTSAPLRTSPVKRGAWLFEHVLGYHLPEPPTNIPLISDDERDAEGLTVRQQLEHHRSKPACFACHERIDPLGVSLERFDAVGRWRDTDLAGEAIDDQGLFVSTGRNLDGLEGLRAYLGEQRAQFVKHFCEQLLGYCLGRAVEPTDGPLLDAMAARLEADGFRPSGAIQLVVASQQFRFRRDPLAE